VTPSALLTNALGRERIAQLRPILRKALEDAKRTLKELLEAVRFSCGDLPEPDESLLDVVRGLGNRARASSMVAAMRATPMRAAHTPPSAVTQV